MRSMTGADVTAVREWLGVDAFTLAVAIGVHVSSVYRWEKSKDPSIDALQLTILDGLHERIKQKRVGEDLGAKIRDALISAGGLGGLYTVLKFLIEGDPHG